MLKGIYVLDAASYDLIYGPAELEQMRFTWHAKDLANAEVMAEAVGLPLPVAATSKTAMTAITVPQVAELLTATGTDEGR